MSFEISTVVDNCCSLICNRVLPAETGGKIS